MLGIKKAGYETATPIQEAAIPAALRGRDLIGTAQTGTGKTAAFVLPILNKLLTGQRNVPRALIVTPTRELAEQIHDVIRVLSAGTRIKSATIYGGVGAGPQVKALRDGAEILVACPGRLLDLINQRVAKMEHIEILVLDEADRMFDMGFLPDVRRIIKAVPAQRQTMLFSATFPSEVELLAASSLKQPQKIAMGISRPAYTVTHALVSCAAAFEVAVAAWHCSNKPIPNSVLIFTRTKYRAQKVAQQIERAGYKVTSLHGDRSQGQRQSALKGFKDRHASDHGRHRHRRARPGCGKHLARHQLRHARHRRRLHPSHRAHRPRRTHRRRLHAGHAGRYRYDSCAGTHHGRTDQARDFSKDSIIPFPRRRDRLPLIVKELVPRAPRPRRLILGITV